jgi:hypothetical protein
MPIQVNGFYIIDDQYFVDFNDSNLKGNKSQNRPHYYCFKDDKHGIYWIIPSSNSRVDWAKSKIAEKEAKGQSCDIVHIYEMGGKESVLLMADMFPVSDKYISRAYTIKNIPFIFKDQKQIKEINKKAKTILALLRNGKRFHNTHADIFGIEKKLIEEWVKEQDKEAIQAVAAVGEQRETETVETPIVVVEQRQEKKEC